MAAVTSAPVAQPVNVKVEHGSLNGKQVTCLDRVRGFLEETQLLESVAAIWAVASAAFAIIAVMFSIEGAAVFTLAALAPIAKRMALMALGGTLGLVVGHAVTRIFDGCSSRPVYNENVFGIEPALEDKNYYHAKCLMSNTRLSTQNKDYLLMHAIDRDDSIGLQLLIQQVGLRGHEISTLVMEPAMEKGVSLELVQTLVDHGFTFQNDIAPEDCLAEDVKQREEIIALVNDNRN